MVEPEELAIARQQLGKHISAAMNTHATIEEVLDSVFSVGSMSYQIWYSMCSERKVCD
jgi:hypothetical protein